MSLIKYGIVPSFRHGIYKQLELINDLAILDYSGKGHTLYNEGHNSLLHIKRKDNSNLFSAPLTSTEISLNNFERLFGTIDDIIKKGYKNIFLMPSAIGELTNFDYQDFAVRITEKYGIKVWYASQEQKRIDPVNMLTSFLEGIKVAQKKREGFSIISPVFSYESKRDARYVKEFIEREYGEKCIFSNAERFSLNDLANLYKSKAVIFLGDECNELVNYICENVNIVKLKCNHIDIESEKQLLLNLNKLFNKEVIVKYAKEYEGITAEFKNLLEFSGRNIVVLLEQNLNERLDLFFKSLQIDVKIYSPYRNDKYDVMSIDDFIDKYKEREEIVVSYDRIVRSINRGITFESLGLDYYLITPRTSNRIMLNGAFNLMEEISKTIKL